MKKSKRRRPRARLAASSDSPFLDERGAGAFLGGIQTKTLQNWRVLGKGPTFLKLGRRVLYRREDLLAWAEAQRHQSTSDKPAAA